RPWWTWIAETPRSFSWCSRTTESTPPDRPTAMPLALGRFLELAIAHQPFEAELDELLGLLLAQLLEGVGERLLQGLGRGLRVAVRAAERLGNDLVDEAEGLQAAGGDAERLGGVGRHGRITPQDGRAALGRNHRVGRVLQHEHDVADRDREGAARAA